MLLLQKLNSKYYHRKTLLSKQVYSNYRYGSTDSNASIPYIETSFDRGNAYWLAQDYINLDLDYSFMQEEFKNSIIYMNACIENGQSISQILDYSYSFLGFDLNPDSLILFYEQQRFEKKLPPIETFDDLGLYDRATWHLKPEYSYVLDHKIHLENSTSFVVDISEDVSACDKHGINTGTLLPRKNILKPLYPISKIEPLDVMELNVKDPLNDMLDATTLTAVIPEEKDTSPMLPLDLTNDTSDEPMQPPTSGFMEISIGLGLFILTTSIIVWYIYKYYHPRLPLEKEDVIRENILPRVHNETTSSLYNAYETSYDIYFQVLVSFIPPIILLLYRYRHYYYY